MKVLILTSGMQGSAAHHLPYLHKCQSIDELAVVFSEGQIKYPSRHRKRKLKKLLKIGPLGALNGVKMRQWYGAGVREFVEIARLDATCETHNVPLSRVPMINGPECMEAFSRFAPDVAISLGNGYIASSVFTIPARGMLNIHHEILPDYQNAQSVIWPLYHGKTSSGYTIHKIDKSIDTGAIVHQEHVPIVFKDTLARTVSATIANLYEASAQGLCRVIDNLDLKLENAEPQGKGGHFTTPSFRQMRKIQKQYERLREP
jgi:methionyl-tRNA formyltransferase